MAPRVARQPQAGCSALVCVVGLRGLPDVMGGVEAHCQELLPRIASLAPDITIEAIARRPYVDGSRASYRGVKVTALPSPRGKNSEAIVSTLVGILHARRRRAAIVHIHAVGPALLAPLARLLGMRIVFTHHGADYERAKWGPFAKTLLRLGERLGVTSASAVIAVAPSLAEQLKAKYPRQAGLIHYLPNGIPAPAGGRDPGPILDRFGLRAHDFVLAVGRLVPEKAFDLLIDAMRDARPEQPLLIVGGADHQSAYSRRLLASQAPGVIFAGVQPHGSLRTLYRSAALFVLPSSHEGLPIAALEAGSSGCPMILSDIQPNLDLGLPERNYFKSGDRIDLAERLRQPADSYGVDRRLFDAFDWNDIAAGTLAIYRTVAFGSRRAGSTGAKERDKPSKLRR